MGEEVARGILQGRRKSIIAKMELRDQPILDQFQDEIFRLPLGIRLALLGPPGTGKTTTLIRRLGQKLDFDNLEPNELALVARADTSRTKSHSRSWLMFTPTDLLRHYVKEAFAREGVRRLRSANTDMVHTSARSCAQQLRRAQNRHRGWSLRHEGQRTDADPRSLCQCDWLV